MADLTPGWEIIILGTGTVFVALIFLGFLVLALQKFFGIKESPSPDNKLISGQIINEKGEKDLPVAAIAAAIHAYRGKEDFKIVRIQHRGGEWARNSRNSLFRV